MTPFGFVRGLPRPDFAKRIFSSTGLAWVGRQSETISQSSGQFVSFIGFSMSHTFVTHSPLTSKVTIPYRRSSS